MPLLALGGALIGSNASNNAASTQASAANHAADLESQASQNALNFEKQQWGQTQANEAPWLQAGANGLSQLQYMLGLGGQNGGSQQGGFPPAQGGPIPGAGGQAPGQMPRATGGPIGRPGANAISAGGVDAMSPQSTLAPGGFGTAGASQFPQANGGPALPPGAGSTTGMHPLGMVGSGTPTGTPLTGAPPNTSYGGYGSLMQPYGETFQAPTGLTEQNDPGYQARLALGQNAMDRSAAARGGVLTGGVAQAENQAAQDYASNEYGNVYNRSLNTYDTNFNAYNTNQANQYNRLASLAGMGQVSAGQLATSGQAASNNVGSNLMGTAQGVAQQLNNAGAANASGIVGSANAWNQGLGSAGNQISQLLSLFGG